MSIGAQASEFVFERIPVLLLCGLWFLLLAGLIFSDLVASIQFFKVTVENEGKATISDICLEAGAKKYKSESLHPGDEFKVFLSVSENLDATVLYTCNGVRRRAMFGAYLDSYHSGTVRVLIDREAVSYTSLTAVEPNLPPVRRKALVPKVPQD